MATRLANLLVVVFLCATCVRAEEEIELDMSDMEASEKTILTVADAGTQLALLTQLPVVVVFFVGVLLLVRELLIWLKTAGAIERREDYSHPYPYGPYSGNPRYNYRQDSTYRVKRDSDNLLIRVLNSIDLMDVTFGVMDVEDDSCRRRAVCELQRAASRMPFLGSFLENISPSINGMAKYKEAQQSGSALEDCKLLFECPYSFLETN
ncbi:uncharacterized protein LOC122262586 isoform X2 [Penaeus japonicus]|uniref:uncharacterized protein LOC122262586 isoform X2 n=1 Tax=Penaeus japonicus TaxID=27405 RepID=UPI001C7145BC|nr:uncharacterized protein LOC122262586 isoform X2 [Penaeus japonicus]